MMILSDTPWKRGELRIKSLNVTNTYCNYSKDKFSNEITFCIPCWLDTNRISQYTKLKDGLSDEWLFMNTCKFCEDSYFDLLEEGWKPEQARTILPNATKTELIMTGFLGDWKHFFDLRHFGTTGTPHPSAKELATPLYEEFVNRSLLKHD